MTEELANDKLKLGEITLQNAQDLKKAQFFLHFGFSIPNPKAGPYHNIRASEATKPIEIKIENLNFYGNTLLRIYANRDAEIPKNRIIEYKKRLFVNANIVMHYQSKIYTLNREKGLLQIISNT